MAFNILNIGYAGDVASPFADRTTRLSDGDTNDIFYLLGTNFGNTPWANPTTSPYLSIIGNTGTGNLVSTGNLVNNNNSLGPSHSTNGDVQYSAVFNFSNVIVQPTGIQIYHSSLGAAPISAYNLQVSSDNITYQTVEDLGVLNSDEWSPFHTNFTPDFTVGFYKYVRVNYTVSTASSWGAVREIKLYGNVKRTDGGEASRLSLSQTINQLPDVTITSPQNGDYLHWENGAVVNKREKLYETIRTTSSVTTADGQYFPNFYIITPSTTETFDLPPNPVEGQFFRVRNLNNLEEVQIRESGPTLLTTIGGSGGPGLTQADCYYDGTEWTIIQY